MVSVCVTVMSFSGLANQMRFSSPPLHLAKACCTYRSFEFPIDSSVGRRDLMSDGAGLKARFMRLTVMTKKKGAEAPAALEQSQFCERHPLVSGHDDVIQSPDIYKTQSLFEPSC